MSELNPCPFCVATPHRGLTKAQPDQLHGEPFQRYRIWCPHGCASIERMNEVQAIEAWNHRPPSPGVEGWQPIETAPKDGTWVQLWRGKAVDWGRQDPLVFGRWSEADDAWVWPDDVFDPWNDIDGAEECLECGDFYESTAFTHWQPLPAPPRIRSALISGGDQP